MDIERYLTVKALTKYIKRKFDADPHLTNVLVKGELSNVKRHSSGHMYFTLKDQHARILGVMFASANRSLKFQPENGMEVLAKADVTVYEAGGQYQLYVHDMQPDGVGALYLAYEQLKQKLEKEGLFAEQLKRPLPRYPKAVAVITSPTGAAVKDVITTIKRRYPLAKLLIYPALVQGDQAAPSVVSAIQKANADNQADVLIVGRGGGSIEELWAFNEEQVARAIRASHLPVISAVGHETDFTIADFVADRRAPTPTGAAEIAVPHLEEVLERVGTRKMRTIRAMSEKLQRERKRLDHAKNTYIMRNPQSLYRQQAEKLDRMTDQLTREQLIYMKQTKSSLDQITARLHRNHPGQQLNLAKERLNRTAQLLTKEMKVRIKYKEDAFRQKMSVLHALSPLTIMERGYSLVYQDSHKLLKSAKQVKTGDSITVQMTDGSMNCQVQTIEVNKDEK
ncbi:exodeoxyribonuclease VII large subunit [Bacillus ectoiniformans]|uniref:exodeoxyribonuclease VII large subunit n=1 Tax=Bacillus ectoiniformans TaxID=1494429 RepID=UPI001958F0DB|nr:exodeoxyribonuclease VII large subunit [Bacillus ectoiniformans]MBM7650430.1 exodeoxyribonuclease VII large subunit [Bacillus ectoiniformans]